LAFHAKPRFKDQLIRNKSAAGRPQDLVDLATLEEIS